jgi:glycosyltransferase involved in cell wall biosynthesis
MHVALLNSLFPPQAFGGAERSVGELADGLSAAGVRVSVIHLSQNGAGPRSRGDVEVHPMRLHNLYWPWDAERSRHSPPARLLWHAIDADNLLVKRELGPLLAETSCDVLHTHNLTGFSPIVWRVAKEQGLPVVHTLRDYSAVCVRSTMFRQGRNCRQRCSDCRVLRNYSRRASSDVDAVIGLSRHVLDIHRAAGWFPNALESRVLLNQAPLPRAPRREHGSTRVVFIGRLAPEKGIELLLDAWRSIERPNAELVIVGSGPPRYVEELRRRSADLAAVQWAGEVPSSEVWPTAAVAVVPSLWQEPLGRVALEALAHGVPVVASRAGGLSEVVEHGRSGIVVEAGRSDLLAEAISTLLGDDELRSRMSEHATRSGSLISPEAHTESHVAVYRRVLQARGSWHPPPA